jgi:hypothetical protein
MKIYFLYLATCFSQTLNVWLLFGHPDQTVSARAYINQHCIGWRLAYKTINKVFFWQANHCYSSHIRDVERAEYIQSLGR